MNFEALNIPIDPLQKQTTLDGLTSAIDQFQITTSIKLDLVSVILNQARYLNHLTYGMYVLVLIIESMIATSAGKIEMMIYLGMACTVFPLFAAIECTDAKRVDLIVLHKTYPFDYGLLLSIRFLYLTLLNSVVLLIYILMVNTMRHFILIDALSAITLIFSMLTLSASNLLIGLKIKNGPLSVLISFMVNAIVQFSLISLLTMIQTMHGMIQILWCMGWIGLAIVCMGLTLLKLRRGIHHGYFSA